MVRRVYPDSNPVMITYNINLSRPSSPRRTARARRCPEKRKSQSVSQVCKGNAQGGILQVVGSLVCICIYLNIYIHIYTHTYIYIYIYVYVYAHIYTYEFTCIHTHLSTFNRKTITTIASSTYAPMFWKNKGDWSVSQVCGVDAPGGIL